MQVYINNELQEFDADLSVEKMLASMQIKPNGIAIAINNTIVSKSKWDGHFIKENDKITIIKATQGG
ncbi:sulfur carrier protein ThiS [Aureibacter tunicatorum]|uniref:Sulfur carrier protein n=1 Tax=Aureibacter tunicatorum TaxID=866807 RepID=A0AAE3XTJ1_9BACT|nr:sulfur carrier protein ThiS [Aureibacter tunicatorum]MDR6241724.1 sulfur carrier protein [Aureibacter tunicatorum]BDD07291.1 thiamine biosynthesis protein ThiS [Aureibacter tunicatorum]